MRTNQDINRKAGNSGGEEFRQRPTLPHSDPCSTIGAEGLYFRVRNGNGCGPFAKAAENSAKQSIGNVPKAMT